MSEPTFIDITDRAHANALSRWMGLVDAELALEKKAKEFERLPGFGLAVALIKAETANARAISVAENCRAVARAGINVADTRAIMLETGPKGSLRLKVEMMDLADIAGAESNA